MAQRLAVVLVVVLGLLATAGIGSAASLTVRGGVVQQLGAARPCTGAATATGPTTATANQTAVRLTVPAGCVGRTVQVTVVDAAGVPHSSAATTVTAATQDVAVSAYVGAANLTARATVDGWDLPTTWSYTPPLPMATCIVIATGAPCSVTVTFDSRTALFWRFDYMDVAVSGATGPWEITFNLDHPGYGSVPSRVGNSILDSDVQVTRQGALCVSNPPRLTVRASDGGAPTAFSLIRNSSNLLVNNSLRSC